MNEYNQPEQQGTEAPTESEAVPPTAPLEGWVRQVDNSFGLYKDGNTVGVMKLEEVADYLNVRAQVIAHKNETITRLESEQIDGSDPRLADFWKKAQDLATEAGHCEIFDQIAEALGGPRRTREYLVNVTGYVTVPVTYSFTVEATDKDEANEQAQELFTDMDASDLEDYADWYNADLDTYSVQSEAELN